MKKNLILKKKTLSVLDKDKLFLVKGADGGDATTDTSYTKIVITNKKTLNSTKCVCPLE